MKDVDDGFFDRADEHINLSNKQVTSQVEVGKVSASFMYAVARFNAYVSASGFSDSEQMSEAREDIITYFVNEYRKMLEENVDDYISRFSLYMPSQNKAQ